MADDAQRVARIPLVEPWLSPACADAVRDQILSGFVGPGQSTKAFSSAIAALAGVAYCSLTPSGTVALSVAARALSLRTGDEVLVPAYGVISTINGFASIGLQPRLVEIDRSSGCMDVDLLEASFRSSTRAVCFVNFSGYTGPNLVRAAALCTARGVPLIEDAACAVGHTYENQPAGSFGTAAIYSFSVPKVLTTGQGGAVLTGNKEVADRAAAFIDQGDLEWRRTNLNNTIGTNLRFNDVLAALGLAQLSTLKERLSRRQAAHRVLRELLGERLYSVPGDEAPLHNVVFAREADRLVASLALAGITATRQYRTLSQHPAYAHLSGSFPNADYWTDRAVYLPFGLALTPDAAARVGEAILRSGLALDDTGR